METYLSFSGSQIFSRFQARSEMKTRRVECPRHVLGSANSFDAGSWGSANARFVQPGHVDSEYLVPAIPHLLGGLFRAIGNEFFASIPASLCWGNAAFTILSVLAAVAARETS
jgi:hypothetical protein